MLACNVHILYKSYHISRMVASMGKAANSDGDGNKDSLCTHDHNINVEKDKGYNLSKSVLIYNHNYM